jgi:3'-phosphoadenosine 5'-phosphosulfate sulfotransferase (PAPS reductase)/FAD synthetase
VTDLITIRRKETDRAIALDHPIETLLADDAPVAIGVSGGKDSCALAFAVVKYLRSIKHAGPVVLVHADLGRVEWRDSIRTCERLAAALEVELVVVRRQSGDMMDRWLQRWADNCARYAELECVRIILPWSTPAMRFCTSELKVDPISRELVRRFPGRAIISAAGIRRQESDGRQNAPISKAQPELVKVKAKTSGLTWNPIVEWTLDDVLRYCAENGFALHEGYTRYGMSRISCAFCIMANTADLISSASCEDNAATYREMVDLEIASTFGFQGSRWLGDVAPHLLTDAQRAGLARAKVLAVKRAELEARIPAHLLYTRGWPTVMPTEAEAQMLAEVRTAVAELLGLEIRYVTAAEILARYAELMAAREARDAEKARKASKRKAMA